MRTEVFITYKSNSMYFILRDLVGIAKYFTSLVTDNLKLLVCYVFLFWNNSVTMHIHSQFYRL